MKKLFVNIFAAIVTVCGMVGIAGLAPSAYAVRCADGHSESDFANCFGDVEIKDKDLNTTLNTAINVVIGIVGFLAVAIIILGGIGFVTSQGDTAKVTKARNTILYGVVGLVVALLAFAIVNFVLVNIFAGNQTS